jgi:hypothetical protein
MKMKTGKKEIAIAGFGYSVSVKYTSMLDSYIWFWIWIFSEIRTRTSSS